MAGGGPTTPSAVGATAEPPGVHRLTADLARHDDGVLLRVVALLHRRRCDVVTLVWDARPATTGGAPTSGHLTVDFTGSPQQAEVVLAGFVHLVGVVRPTLHRAPPSGHVPR